MEVVELTEEELVAVQDDCDKLEVAVERARPSALQHGYADGPKGRRVEGFL
jgi:hypothetical protein